MSQPQKFRCVLMGSHSRLIGCGEILLEKGHEIPAVVAAEPDIELWVRDKGLQLFDPGDDLLTVLAHKAFDLFLSIDNFSIVSDEVLRLARKLAINFHDGPLPRYAGINATNWALLNHEQEHGVTWHVMSGLIDGGDILKQKIFPVSPEETALTLNSKCYEQSLTLFAELIDELAENRIKPVPQELGRRTYFGMWKRPPAACVIDWHSSARQIDALCRALHQGTYPNPMGLAKLYLGRQAVVVPNVRVLPAPKDLPSGTITLIDDNHVQVASGAGEVAIETLLTLDGETVAAGELLSDSGFRPGDVLPMLAPEKSERLTKLHSEFCKHESFWKQQLGTHEGLELPYRKPQQLGTDGRQYRALAFPVVRSIRHDARPADHLLAGIIAYLFRASAKTGFNVALNDAALREKLGDSEAFFATELPVRIEIDPWATFAEFERKVLDQIDSVRNHGTYLRDLPLREPSLKKTLQQHGRWTMAVGFERVQTLTGPAGPSAAGAELVIRIADDGQCEWRYDQAVFEYDSICRMQEQSSALIDDSIARPDRPLAELSIVTAAEREQVITQWNATHVEYAADACLHKLFESQVQRSPNRTALKFSGRQLTYGELNGRANQLAHYLRKLGVRPDTLVAVCMERSIELVVALYGVLKAGGAYVPIDPEYPEERISYMLQDCAAPVLLTQSRLLSLLPPFTGAIISLDSERETIAREENTDPANVNRPDDLAYMIYTSGSTGRPKGAMNTHRGICNRLLWMQDQYQLTSDDKVLQKTPFSFDVSVWEFFWPLLVGAQLVVSEPGAHRDPAYLIRVIADEEITVLHFVPSMLRIFLEEPGVDRCRSLRHVMCSGEALPFALQQRFFQLLSCQLHNLYGPTEAAVDVTYWKCERDSSRQIVPIGRPVANAKVYILDRYFQPVPVGMAGELFIAGVQVGRGYHNRPELTAERFLPDPFSSARGARMYRTGDLCRWLPDGAVEYLGRLDFQVKLRGLRIELGEIEAALSAHPSVKNCVVVAREDGAGDKQLIAYVVAQANGSEATEEWRQFLLRKLPDYMVPATFVTTKEIPLSPNGKVDQRALSLLPVERVATPDRISVPPATEIEHKIAEIWRAVLKTRSVGVNENFFDVGGDSLRLMNVRALLNRTLRTDVPIVDLFRFTTIRTLAQHLAGGTDDIARASTESAVETRRNASKERKQMRREARVA